MMPSREEYGDNAKQCRLEGVKKGYGLGFSFVPLSGKRPLEKGWVRRPRETLDEAFAWARNGNIGVRTGTVSGIVVVDVDPGADLNALGLPPTPAVETGRGGRHFYFQAPDEKIGNSAGTLAKHVDLRGDGGQVVFVGSLHPDTGVVYQWVEGRSPDDVPIAPLPDWILEKLRPRPSKSPPLAQPGPHRGSTPYGQAALKEECQKVRIAPEGGRNDQLNGSAFALGQLVAGGELEEDLVRQELLAATTLDEAEALATIESGLRAGMQGPRTAPQSRSSVFVPGAHTDDTGKQFEISEKGFALEVLHAIPGGVLYRRGEPPVAGQLLGEPGSRCFVTLESDALRLLAGEHVRLQCWRTSRTGAYLKTIPFNKSHAGLVTAGVVHEPSIHDIQLIVPYPAYGCSPGWNENGVYFDQDPALKGVSPETHGETIHCVLEDLLIDFPFKDEASRQNFIALMLTPLLRPLIEGNVPMHLVHSSLERTGKTKLCEEVLGGVLLGHPTPALQLSGSEAEIDKRLVGLLLRGGPLVHLDNLGTHIDSPSLASVLTASTYQGRILGVNAMPALANRMVFVASGNNVQMSGEIAKRTVPILLQPSGEAPELRDDFHHPRLREYIRGARSRVLSCLLGMIQRWEEQDRPKGIQRLGGFESWVEIVGGVMRANRYSDWLSNARAWQREADPHGEDLEAFVRTWHERFGTGMVQASQLLDLAFENDLFLQEIRSTTEKGRLSSFSKRVLGRHKDTPVGGFIIRQAARSSSARLWSLDPISPGVDQ